MGRKYIIRNNSENHDALWDGDIVSLEELDEEENTCLTLEQLHKAVAMAEKDGVFNLHASDGKEYEYIDGHCCCDMYEVGHKKSRHEICGECGEIKPLSSSKPKEPNESLDEKKETLEEKLNEFSFPYFPTANGGSDVARKGIWINSAISIAKEHFQSHPEELGLMENKEDELIGEIRKVIKDSATIIKSTEPDAVFKSFPVFETDKVAQAILKLIHREQAIEGMKGEGK